jgi:adenylate kinase
VYREQTAPLVAYYEERDLLHRIDGVGTVDAVRERIREAANSAGRATK